MTRSKLLSRAIISDRCCWSQAVGHVLGAAVSFERGRDGIPMRHCEIGGELGVIVRNGLIRPGAASPGPPAVNDNSSARLRQVGVLILPKIGSTPVLEVRRWPAGGPWSRPTWPIGVLGHHIQYVLALRGGKRAGAVMNRGSARRAWQPPPGRRSGPWLRAPRRAESQVLSASSARASQPVRASGFAAGHVHRRETHRARAVREQPVEAHERSGESAPDERIGVWRQLRGEH